MATEVTTRDIEKPFRDMLNALDPKEQRNAMRSAMRKEATKLKKAVATTIGGSKLGKGTKQPIANSVRSRVHNPKYGLGFSVTVKPHGKKGYHRNRKGQEKPILMWAEEGTKLRKTKSKTKIFVRTRKGHSTGRMDAYGILSKTEQRESAGIEQRLFDNFEAQVEKRLRKKGLL